MSQQYSSPKDVPVETICIRLEELARAVAAGPNGRPEFTMRIPAECDRDADLVMDEAAKRLRLAREENARLVNALRNVRAHTGHTKMAPDQLHIELLEKIGQIVDKALLSHNAGVERPTTGGVK